MHAGEQRGPEVGPREELLRAITQPSWWVQDQKRASSAAFRVDSPFSVDVRSMTTDQDCLSRFERGSGLVVFVAGVARDLGYDTRLEPDEDDPNHTAHAHVYSDFGNKQGKKAARKLADLAALVVEPTFGST